MKLTLLNHLKQTIILHSYFIFAGKGKIQKNYVCSKAQIKLIK